MKVKDSRLTLLTTDIVSFQSALINVGLAEDSGESDTAQALVFVLHFINDAISLVLAETNWADWCNPSFWNTVSDGFIKVGSAGAWHTNKNINFSAHNV